MASPEDCSEERGPDVKGDQAGQAVTRPMNGDEYIESLGDGRQIYIHGERVEDVTTHPAFRSVRSIARLYNALHDPRPS